MKPLNTVKIKDGESYRIINESDFKYDQHVLCEGEKPLVKPITVGVQIGITPEFQAVLDEAKAECEKVVAENDVLKALTTTLEATLDAANARIAELEAIQAPPPKKLTAAEIKAAKVAEETKVAEPQE